ncbi:MAG: NUDIX hydrolase [Smithellaceae bacterium]|nr:NUDIX hydrolase [Smithellaceae bacterium]
MTQNKAVCSLCKREIKAYRNPFPTVDIIIERAPGLIILIKRKNPPPGWALPGGFVDYGESLEEGAIREAREETNLIITSLRQMHIYSRPDRDPRFHTIATVFVAQAEGSPKAQDDATEIGIFSQDNLPEEIAFDHREILGDYFRLKQTSPFFFSSSGGKPRRR